MGTFFKGIAFTCGGLTVLGVGVVAIIALIGVGMSGDESGGGEEPSGPGASQDNAVSLGETAEIGEVSWQVTDVEQTSEISDSIETVRGNFVIADVAFTNNSQETVTLDSGSLAIEDGEGRVSEGSEDASFILDSDMDLFLNEVNPGVTEEARVAFDVAPDSEDMLLRANDAGLMSENYVYIELGV